MAGPGFWDDQEAARKVIDEANDLKRWTEPMAELTGQLSDLEELIELAEDEDEEMLAELGGDIEQAAQTDR